MTSVQKNMEYASQLPTGSGGVRVTGVAGSALDSQNTYNKTDNNNKYESVEEDEEMSSTERELAEDAAWKRIQQNTFTR